MNLITENNINKNNYFDATMGYFNPVDPKIAVDILDAYRVWRRKKNRPEFIEAQPYGKLSVNFESIHRSELYGRSISLYFIPPSNDRFIRISDHWSKSKYGRSGKLNCGWIRKCLWYNLEGNSFPYTIPSEKYPSILIAGECKFSDMITTLSMEKNAEK